MNPQEIKQWLDDVWNILVDLNISIFNAKRLSENKYEHEDKIKSHGFLQHHWFQLRFIMVIQLAKLISDNERNHKRSLPLLIKKLKPISYDDIFLSELKNMQPDIFFEVCTSVDTVFSTLKNCELLLDENSAIVEKVVTARNQTYAHNDPIPDKKIPSMVDIEKLINACNKIYNQISGEFFKSRTGFEHTTDWDIDYILKELSENRVEKLKKYRT